MKKRIVYAAIPILCIICTIYIYIINNSNDNAIITGDGGLAPENDDRQTVITIIHTNDLHGRFEEADGLVGIATVAAVKKSMDNALLVDAGDALYGTPFANIGKGSDTAKLMEMAGYDLRIPGNHEFDYGDNHFLDLISGSAVGYISANIIDGQTPVFPSTHFIEVKGVKIGFIGVTAASDYRKADYNIYPYSRFTFKDPIEAAQAQLEYVKQEGADVIIALTHIGLSNSEMLAEIAPDIDIIIDGHSHSDVADDYIHNGVLIATAHEHGKKLGFVTVALNGNKQIINKSANAVNAEEIKETYSADEAIQAMVNETRAKADAAVTAPGGDNPYYIHDTMDGGEIQVRVRVENPGAFSDRTLFSANIKGEAIDKLMDSFTSRYRNNIQIILFDHHTGFAEPVHVSAKVDLTGMDIEKLEFYAYNPYNQNRFLLSKENLNHYIDGDGYLNITTPRSGSIIISEGTLKERQ